MQLLPGVRNPATAVTIAVATTAIIFIALMPLASSKEQLSSRECEDLGFTGLALCSDCHTLSEYIKDQGDAFNSLVYFTLFLDSVLNLYLYYCISSVFVAISRELAVS